MVPVVALAVRLREEGVGGADNATAEMVSRAAASGIL